MGHGAWDRFIAMYQPVHDNLLQNLEQMHPIYMNKRHPIHPLPVWFLRQAPMMMWHPSKVIGSMILKRCWIAPFLNGRANIWNPHKLQIRSKFENSCIDCNDLWGTISYQLLHFDHSICFPWHLCRAGPVHFSLQSGYTWFHLKLMVLSNSRACFLSPHRSSSILLV